MTETQLADYLAGLREARLARLNGARPQSPVEHVLRRQASGALASQVTMHEPFSDIHERRREQEEALSLRMALDDLDLKEEAEVLGAAHADAIELIKADVLARSIALDVETELPAAPETQLAQTVKSREVNMQDCVQPDSPQTYHKTFKKRGYQGLARAVAADIANSRRRISSGSKRKASSDRSVFPNRQERIYEEPQEAPVAAPAVDGKFDDVPDMPRHVRKNPFARIRFTQGKLERTKTAPTPYSRTAEPPVEPVPVPVPATLGKPLYSSNDSATSLSRNDMIEPRDSSENVITELRSDEIRAATSKRFADQSERLPRPSAVSHSPKRPIASFQPDWKPEENDTAFRHRPEPSKPIAEDADPATVPVSTSIPEIEYTPLPSVAIPEDQNLPESEDVVPHVPVPSINLTDQSVPPAIVLPSRPRPTEPVQVSTQIQATSRSRPLLQHAATTPNLLATKPQLPPSSSRNPSLCSHCALPISGRVLTAAGERLHPDCFSCHQCKTNLECVAFYPEPDSKYYERLARIQQRISGLDVSVPKGMSVQEVKGLEESDGDDSLRYFCHLDFHELFSPRCKSCKTPIEGQVVVACGAEWHVGHFFCAQCGDVCIAAIECYQTVTDTFTQPFDADKPYVEQDKYAWCVGCHTNRYGPKCKKCRKPVGDVALNALGADWHEDCFCCVVCISHDIILPWPVMLILSSNAVPSSRMGVSSCAVNHSIQSASGAKNAGSNLDWACSQ